MPKPVLKEELRAAAKTLLPKTRVDFATQNARLVDENSVFYGAFRPDDYTSFVEFDICHSLPVIAGPAYHTGNFTCLHPATLSRSHRCLLHKQTNLHHFIKSYDPEEVSRDRIVGAIVMSAYPPEPDGGWQIPASKEEAIPIHACAAIFKQAEGAIEMLQDHKSGRQQWSVSIEMEGTSFDEMGIFVPSQKKIIPLLEMPDEMLSQAITRDDCGCFCIGKWHGEQLVLAYGGNGGNVIFRGVGFTPTPAEREAQITAVSLSTSQPKDYELEEKSGGIMAMCASSASEAIARAAVEANFPGSRLIKVHASGKARIDHQPWHIAASAEKPVVEVELARGGKILRYLHEIAS